MNPNKKIRRLQSLLYTSGRGTILFSLWSVIRGFAEIYDFFRKPAESGESGISAEMLKTLSLFIVFILIILLLSLYTYIGRKAIQTSLGKKTSNKYIVLAIITVVFSASSYVPGLLTLTPSTLLHSDDIMLTIIDFTSDVILAEVVVFSVLLKKLR